jgi:Lrp/AsnC family transcriptional regulator, leucine-responsive regulatory protein
MPETEGIDEIDRQILGILARDGRTPIVQVAEQVGLSRPAVSDRIEKLERSGVIRGSSVVVDPAALGMGVTAFISARQSATFEPKAEEAFRALLGRDEVVEVHTVAGEDCYLVKVRTSSIAALNLLVNELSAPPLELSTRTTIVMETHVEKVGGVLLAGGIGS